MTAFVDRIIELDPATKDRIVRFSARRKQALKRLEPRAKENLAYQKESLSLALKIAGLPADDLLAWSPTDDEQQSFLDSLPGAKVTEDIMVLRDFSSFPGLPKNKNIHYASKVFSSDSGPIIRLTVIMSNRQPLEKQTGVDLIYFNETYRSFVMVQYKAMEERGKQKEFRWQKGDQFCKEIARTESVLQRLKSMPGGHEPHSFRFTDNPFFLKFCSRVVFKPDDKKLFPGIYLPLNYWKTADVAGCFKGKYGGKVLTYDNVRRHINNTEFAGLVAKAWVGTTTKQSSFLKNLIWDILSSGKTVTFATGSTMAATE